jgi:hypothetical protein
MSWDAQDRLWATSGGQLFMLPGGVTPQSSGAAPEVVDVFQASGSVTSGPITAVRVAPDGVRVALIQGTGKALYFGGIAAGSGPLAGAPEITLSPFNVSGGTAGFSSLSWYGADDVITLGAGSGSSGPALTEYAVTGASSTQLPTAAGIQSVTSSANSELVAGTKSGTLMGNPGPSGAWAPLGSGGLAPAYPG